MITFVECDPDFLTMVSFMLDVLEREKVVYGRKKAYDKFCKRSNLTLAKQSATITPGVEYDPETIAIIAAIHYLNLLLAKGVL